MAASRREALLALIHSVLLGTPGAGSRVYRSRVEPLAKGETGVIVVEPLSDEASVEVLDHYDWALMVQIAVMVRGNIPDQAADSILVAAHQRLMNSPTLASSVIGITPIAVDWERSDGDMPLGVTLATYSIRYRTQQGALDV